LKFATNVAALALIFSSSIVSPLASSAAALVPGSPASGSSNATSAVVVHATSATTSATASPPSTPWSSTSQIIVTTDSTGAVTYTLDPSNTAPCSVDASAGTVSSTDAGTCIVDANVAGDVNFSASSATVTVTFTTVAATTSATASPTSTPWSSTSQITVTTDSTGAVTYTLDPSNAAPCSVGVSGTVSATGPGTCIVDANVAGDANYSASSTTVTVTFTAIPTSGGGTTDLVQTAFQAGSVSSTSSGTFAAGPITVEGNSGPVTFATTKPSPSLVVSSSGTISTTGTLSAGSYSVSGTDADAHGDSGTWAYTLSVTAATVVLVTVLFVANAGAGAMTPESASAPTTLSPNSFVRKGYTFVDWNTNANGSGISYANGALFPFVAPTTLFAQWKRGKSPKRTITFARNGGTGATASEIENTPTAITPNHFTRPGYTFVDWNTTAKGSGARFEPGATYPFKKSITLYAQWKRTRKSPPKAPTKAPHPKVAVHVVTFAANGGAGTMATESRRSPTTLTPNHFTRSGYTFVDWNSRANGSGSSYASSATYSFRASTTLYAQWKKVKVVPPTPAIPGGVIIGPFGTGSSSLSPALDSQIQSLANEAKSKGAKQLTLYGFGDSALKSDTNAQLGRARAVSVASYLEARLAAIGLKGWTIAFEVASPSPTEVAAVVATLS
jgi:uncharacterized repeat protein (TIGR02543 family)